jgi:selenocysteine lyase/cysteine desulfurase
VPSASIVSVPVDDAPAVKLTLEGEGIRGAATTPHTIRLSPHIYNSSAEIDRTVEVLAPLLN